MIFISFHYRYRKQIFIISLFIIVLVSSSIYLYLNNKETKEEEPLLISKKEEKPNESQQIEKYKVDIKGQILKPGIYEMTPSSRVIDIINEAGGLTDKADTSVINLSKKITDEMVIIIYSKDEVNDFKKTKEIENQVITNCIQKDETSLKNDACITNDTASSSTKISLNTATKEQLMTLPGIGESKAEEIINYRNTNGPFKTIEDLKQISGIGESIFAKIKENITI